MSPSTITIAPATDLPAGAVRLLTDALASTRPRLRWVCRLRAVHAAWLLRGLNGDEARVAVARDGDELVGVALAVRYDARPGPAQLGILTVAALALGAVVGAVGLPPVGLLAALTITVAAGTLGAVCLDGRDGLAGARTAHRRAQQVGPDRCWGRGLVGVAPEHHGRGIGTAVTRGLVTSLPHGDRWLPVALTERAAALYDRLGATRLGGRASELVVGPTAAAVPASDLARAA